MHMTQQGVKKKKRFHNRLAALRTASKAEIEAADNIFQIMGFSARNKIKEQNQIDKMTNGKNPDQNVIQNTITLSINIYNETIKSVFGSEDINMRENI